MTAPTDIAFARAALFVPGHRADRFDKALAAGADAVIMDLEDAVPPAEKPAARAACLARLERPVPPGAALGIRMNQLPTPEGIADLAAIATAAARPSFLLLPKTESAEQVAILHRVLAAGGAPVPVVALIESAAGLVNAAGIAAAPGCAALGFGGVDLAADLRCAVAWEPLLPHRGALVVAAARAGVGLLDVPFLALDDAAELEAECRRVQALGFTGKLAIHPRQVATILGVFTPTPDEVAWAQRIVDAMRAAQGGVCVVDGAMVDAPVERAARRILARARAA